MLITCSSRTLYHSSFHSVPRCRSRQPTVCIIRAVQQGIASMVESKPLYTSKWWNEKTVAVVTGSNKGIGYEIARIYAEQGLRVVMTARNEELLKAAADQIRAVTKSTNIETCRLDIADLDSINEFANWAEKNLDQPISILMNNAGFAYKGNVFGADEAKVTLDTNFVGTANVCETLLSRENLMDPHARIVNITSLAGELRILKSDELKRRFESASTYEQVKALADEFVAGIAAGDYDKKGWPSSMYGVSKLCLAMYTRNVLSKRHPGLMVNCVCPGYVATDMSSGRGYKTPAQGADTPVWVSLLSPSEAVNGLFFSDRTAKPF